MTIRTTIIYNKHTSNNIDKYNKSSLYIYINNFIDGSR